MGIVLRHYEMRQSSLSYRAEQFGNGREITTRKRENLGAALGAFTA